MTTGTDHRIPVALITGASRGLGASMARHLARAGVGIIGTYLHGKDAADALVADIGADGGRAAVLPLDVADSDGFEQFAARLRSTLQDTFGRPQLDHLVNNAGSAVYAPFAQTTRQQFDEMVAIQLRAPFFLTQTLLPLIADGGHILNVSSGLARFTGPGYAAYAMTKGGIEVLTRYQARELGERGIRVNVIAPGAIATDFGGGVVRDNPQVNAAIAEATSLGRVGRPDDIGAAVTAILTGGLDWASGTRIEVSGGQQL